MPFKTPWVTQDIHTGCWVGWGCENKQTPILLEHKGVEVCDTLELPCFRHCQQTVQSQCCHSYHLLNVTQQQPWLQDGPARLLRQGHQGTAWAAGEHEVLDARSNCPSWSGGVYFCWVCILFDLHYQTTSVTKYLSIKNPFVLAVTKYCFQIIKYFYIYLVKISLEFWKLMNEAMTEDSIRHVRVAIWFWFPLNVS